MAKQRITALITFFLLGLAQIFAFSKEEISLPSNCVESGYVKTYISQSGVANVSNISGAPNGQAAQLWEQNDQVVVELDHELPSGTTYTVTWRRGPNTSSNPTVRVEESTDGNNWFSATGSEFNFSNLSFFQQNINANRNTRYLRFTTLTVYDVDIDAVSYSYNIPCPDCTAFSSISSGTTCGNTDGSVILYNLLNAARVDIWLESPSGSGNWTNLYPNSNSPSNGSYTINNLAAGTYRVDLYGFDANGNNQCLKTIYPLVGTPGDCIEACTSAVSTIFEANFENTTGNNNWSFGNGASDGNWEIGTPFPYTTDNTSMEIVAYGGTSDLLTGSGNGQDLDGGPATAQSPTIVLADPVTDISLQLRYYFSHAINGDNNDYLLVQIKEANTNTLLSTIVNETGTASRRNAVWDLATSDLTTHAGKTIYIYVEAADYGGGSKLEAAIDNVIITQTELCQESDCDDMADNDGDGDVDCDDSDCYIPVITTITPTNPANCPFLNNGRIVVAATGINLEYSKDNGLNYQSTNEFTNLEAGTYTIRARNSVTKCVADYTNNIIELTNSPCVETDCGDLADNDNDGDYDCDDSDCYRPAITTIIPIHPSNCPTLNNAQIIIIATGVNLEYSKDGGSTYQLSNTFSGLLAGTYDIVVRNSVTGCITEVSVNEVTLVNPTCVEICGNGIDDDDNTLTDCDDPVCGRPGISSVTFTHPNNCPNLNNGEIQITATGSTLEYSINGGTDFQSSSTFSGLIEKTYFIVVRNATSGCDSTYISNPVNLVAAACSSNLIVNHTGDTGDANPGDGTCADASGNCTLRAAIEEANANGNGTELDNIQFNLPANSVITLSAGLSIIEQVYIDGYSQPNSTQGDVSTCTIHTGLIEIVSDGSYVNTAFDVNANNVTIRGFYIHGFTSTYGAIGVKHTYKGDNIYIEGNILSGNRTGVYLSNSGRGKVLNNFIGVSPDYSPQGNTQAGIALRVNAYNTVVENNLVVHNGTTATYGIQIDYSATRIAVSCDTIRNNYVGTDCNELDLGNEGDGIYISQLASQSVFIQDNDVAYNGGNGIRVYNPTSGNTCLSRNQTWQNGSSGIRGPSASYGNVPTIESVEFNGKYMEICITTVANATIDLFTGDPTIADSRTQEGKNYLISLKDDGSGTTCHSVDMSTLPVCVYDFPVFDAVVNELDAGCGCVSSVYESFTGCIEGIGTCEPDCIIIDPQIEEVICDNTTGLVSIALNPIASEAGSTYTVSVSSGTMISSSSGTYGSTTIFSYQGHTAPVTITIQDNTFSDCVYSFVEGASCNYVNPANQNCFSSPLKPVECYFIPITESEGYTVFQSISPNRIEDPIRNFITMSAVQNNTTIFYDHFEDGYEATPFVKTQSSTEIWGDGNVANGVAPGTTNDLITRGETMTLITEVISQNPSGIAYGGRDKVLSTGGLTMARLLYPSDTNGNSLALYAGGTEVYSTQEWGATFELPVGSNANVNNLFDYVGFSIMAQADNTTIEIDHDADGIVDIISTLSTGESYLVNGTPATTSTETGFIVNQGATIKASEDVQVNMFTGNHDATYEMRWFNLSPKDQWGSSYFNPVGTMRGANNDTSRTFIHVYNPNNTSITINWKTEGNTTQTPINLAPNSGTYLITPDSSGVQLYSSEGDFYALATVDSDGSNNSAHDWGFTLLPENRLYNQIVAVSFAGGDDPYVTYCQTPANNAAIEKENGAPVWLTANYPSGQTGAATTQIAIDFNGNGGPKSDSNGTPYDTLMTINMLESKKVFDPDGDQTGMKIWVADGSAILLAAAWGQDPSIASSARPAMDFGYTISSGLAIAASKEHSYLIDANSDQLLGVEDRAKFSILVHNIGNQPLSNISIKDTLPEGLAYYPNSAQVETCSTNSSINDQAGSNSTFPLDETGYVYTGILLPGESIRITYETILDTQAPVGLGVVTNKAFISDGVKTITITDEIELSSCFLITSVAAELVICSEEIVGEIAVTTNDSVPHKIRFIRSANQLLTAAAIYAATDTIDIVAITANTDRVAVTDVADFLHDGGTDYDTLYIYAVLDDEPLEADCQPYAETRIVIRPASDAGCIEICDNEIDDNGDGKIDYQDDRCIVSRPRIKRTPFTTIPDPDPEATPSTASEVASVCETTEYIFEIESDQSNFTYNWDFGSYADSSGIILGNGPHLIQFDTPKDTVAVYTEVILTSIFTSSTLTYEVKDTFGIFVRPLPKIKDIVKTPPNGCGGSDGSLVFELTKSADACIEISLNGGINWSAANEVTFPNLAAQDYDIMLRYCDGGCAYNYSTVTLDSPYTFKLVDDNFPNNCPGQLIQNSAGANDTIQGNNVRYLISDPPDNGMVTIDNTGFFEYEPNSDNITCDSDEFEYQVCDVSQSCCVTATVFLNFSDDDDPILSNVPADVTLMCDEFVPAPELVSASDNCPAISLDLDEVNTRGEDGCSQHLYTLTRTWTAADACGNTTQDSQKIYVSDVTAPNIFRIYTLPGGQRLVAGVTEHVNQNWKVVSFPIDFTATPIIFSQVISTEEHTPVTTRIKEANSAQFQLKIQEEQGEDSIHVREKVAWMAIESGFQIDEFELHATTINVTEAWEQLSFAESSTFNETPAFFAAMQTTQDEDPSTIRYQQLTGSGVELKIEEETSIEADITHTEERIGYLALDNIETLIDNKGKPLGEVDVITVTSDWEPIELKYTYINPVVITSGLGSNAGSLPGIIRVANVKANGFDIRIEGWGTGAGTDQSETVSYLVVEGSIPLDASEICDTGTDGLEIGVDLIAIDNCDLNITIQYKEEELISGPNLQTIRTWYVEDECGNPRGYSQVVNCTGVSLQMKAILQGAMIDNGKDGMMRDDLRAKGLLPTLEPYSSIRGFNHVGDGGGEECGEDLLALTGEGAIVDWVFIELRSSDDPDEIIATCSGLLQCNGQVVNVHGEDVIEMFNIPPGSYYVGLKHRNHLPVVSLRPYTFSPNKIPFIDFTDVETISRGTEPTIEIKDQTLAAPGSGRPQAIWSGDLNGDNEVIFQGPGNDIFFMFLQVLLDKGNEDRLTNYISEGYTEKDFNMDGTVIYQGPNNDKAVLLWNTILEHPENSLDFSNFIVSTEEEPVDLSEINCTLDPTNINCDADADQIPNEKDTDDDNDGVADGDDSDPFDPNSDSDGDGYTDIEETTGAVYSDPLSACDPDNSHVNCVGIDHDNDGCYSNYSTTDTLFDEDDRNPCFPIDVNCNCPDTDGDGYILICTGKELDGKGRTIKIKLSEWGIRQAVQDVCGPCQE